MTYQVLARKYRPRDFSEVIGQAHVVQALSNALAQQYLHHAYLLTGTRGVGKTTIARILAKCLNCEKGISPSPCGKCNTCDEIDSGRFVDLYEVDAASRTKVEDTRELLDNVQYAPTKGRYKIYLIDEVHMLSGHSFNALLKTLEEPPPHVKFLLATTDPQRLPATVLSRCLQFHLSLMDPEQIATHLQTILNKEEIKHDDAATLLIGKAANGSMRDALSLLDQSIAFGNGSVLAEDTKQMLGTIDTSTLYDILTALTQQNADALLAAIQQLAEHGTDFSHALDELLNLLHQITVLQVAPNAANESTPGELITLAEQITPADVQLFYQIGILGQRDLPLAPTPRVGFEMTVLRMLAFIPANMKTQNAPQKSTSQTTSVNTQTTTAAPTDASVKWDTLLKELNLTGAALALAQQCSLDKIEADTMYFTLSPKQKPLLNETYIDRISAALTQHFKRQMRAVITLSEHESATPAELKEARSQERQASAKQAIYQDEQVQRIMQTFDATVIEQSIKPINNENQ